MESGCRDDEGNNVEYQEADSSNNVQLNAGLQSDCVLKQAVVVRTTIFRK
jgi:hypothetical protein